LTAIKEALELSSPEQSSDSGETATRTYLLLLYSIFDSYQSCFCETVEPMCRTYCLIPNNFPSRAESDSRGCIFLLCSDGIR